MPRVLVVEDDDAIAEPLVRALGREGYEVEHVPSGEAALALFDDPWDLLVLDVGLPGIDGIEVCRRARELRPRPAILMLTARSSELDEVLGLDAGADDYVTKPFTLAVLSARVRALLRREDTGAVESGGVRVDPSARRAWRDGEELELSPKEFDLLAYLVENAGTAVRRDELMQRVWDENWWGSTKTLDVHIGWLRRKLGEPPLITHRARRRLPLRALDAPPAARLHRADRARGRPAARAAARPDREPAARGVGHRTARARGRPRGRPDRRAATGSGSTPPCWPRSPCPGTGSRRACPTGASSPAATRSSGPRLRVRAGNVTGGVRVTVIAPRNERTERIGGVWLAVAVLSLIAVAVAVGLALLQARRLAGPLERLARRATTVGHPGFNRRPAPSGVEELDAVEHALVEADERIAALLQREREFSANASHQLRSPLTGLRMRLEELQAIAGTADAREEATAALGQVDRLLATIAELEALARAQESDGTPADLAGVTRAHTRAAWVPRFAAAGRELRVDAPGSALVRLADEALRQLLDVLLDNALRHGAGTTTVAAEATGPWARLAVAGRGRGRPRRARGGGLRAPPLARRRHRRRPRAGARAGPARRRRAAPVAAVALRGPPAGRSLGWRRWGQTRTPSPACWPATASTCGRATRCSCARRRWPRRCCWRSSASCSSARPGRCCAPSCPASPRASGPPRATPTSTASRRSISRRRARPTAGW